MSNKINTVTPLSASYANHANGKLTENAESEIQLKGGPVLATVLIAGFVSEIQDREGFRAILVNDGSEYKTIRDYKEENKVELKIGDIIRAYGSFRKNKQGDGINFTAYQIKKCETQNSDQFSVIMLETVLGHLAKPETANVAIVGKQEAGEKMEVNTGHASLPLKDGITADHNKVLNVVLGVEAEEGAQVPNDFQHLGIPMDKVKNLLQSLADEGHIYSTVDDNHFKST